LEYFFKCLAVPNRIARSKERELACRVLLPPALMGVCLPGAFIGTQMTRIWWMNADFFEVLSGSK